MSDGTSGGVFSRRTTAEDAEEASFPVILTPPTPSAAVVMTVVRGSRESATTELGRERSSCGSDGAVDEDASEVKVDGGRSGTVP